MGYRLTWGDTDLEQVVTSATEVDRDVQLDAAVVLHNTAQDLIVCTEVFSDLDSNNVEVFVGKVYYRAASLV